MLLDGRAFKIHIAARASEPGKPVYSDFTVAIDAQIGKAPT